MKKIILASFALLFSVSVFAQNGYKQAEAYCGQFGQKPVGGTNNNHQFKYESGNQSGTEKQNTGSQYKASGGANVETSGLAKKIATATAGANIERTSSREDKRSTNTNSTNTTEYYNCEKK